jgi:mRNA interferase RelE/StbE
VSYQVVILRRAQRDLDKIASPSYELIKKRLVSLSEDPRPPGCQKMRDREGAWRIRSGDYRIIYEIDDSKSMVTVLDIGHRREIYR